MRCDTVMQREVFFAELENSAREAAEAMRDKNIGFLPVCDSTGRVVGTLTDRDLALRVCATGRDASLITVGEVMTEELVACGPDDSLSDAERLMAERGKSRIVVVDEDDRLLGVISMTDIAWRDSNKHTAHTLRKIVAREAR